MQVSATILRIIYEKFKLKEGIFPMPAKKAPATAAAGAEYWSGRWDSNPRRPAWENDFGHLVEIS